MITTEGGMGSTLLKYDTELQDTLYEITPLRDIMFGEVTLFCRLINVF